MRKQDKDVLKMMGLENNSHNNNRSKDSEWSFASFWDESCQEKATRLAGNDGISPSNASQVPCSAWWMGLTDDGRTKLSFVVTEGDGFQTNRV